jgi:hypothetical protein
MSKNKRTIPPLPAKPQPKSNPLLKANLAKVKLAKVKMPRVKMPRVKIKKTRRRRASDLRIRRTRGRLSNALVELMRDKSIDQITVQQVLQQALWAAPLSIFTIVTKTICSLTSWKTGWKCGATV